MERRPIPGSRRIATWLGLALLVASSTPHFHFGAARENHTSIAGYAGAHATNAAQTNAAQTDAATAATDAVSSDDQHDEHESRPSLESSRCRLCRSPERQPLDRTPPGARLFELTTHSVASAPAPTGLGSRFASVHPARAPPRLLRA